MNFFHFASRASGESVSSGNRVGESAEAEKAPARRSIWEQLALVLIPTCLKNTDGQERLQETLCYFHFALESTPYPHIQGEHKCLQSTQIPSMGIEFLELFSGQYPDHASILQWMRERSPGPRPPAAPPRALRAQIAIWLAQR